MKMFFLNSPIFKGQIDDINDEIKLNGSGSIIDLNTDQSFTYHAVAGY